MHRRPLFWCLVSLICLGGSVYFWRLGNKWQAEKNAAQMVSPAPAHNAAVKSVPHLLAPTSTNKASLAATTANTTNRNLYPYRLSNTAQSLSKLAHNEKGILLANALIDTAKPVDLAIPARLRAPANNGSYIVQARGLLDNQFRATLANANATIVSYIPNNAYLVRVSDSGAQELASNPQTQSVLPYEPYYKLDAPLLKTVMENLPLPANNGLNVTVFPDAYQATVQALQQLGANIVSEESSPFGPVLRVQPAADSVASLASLPGVHQIGFAHSKQLANDLFRPRVEVAADSVTALNYLNLTGSNVLVNINDTGVDTNHPDFASGRITGDSTNALSDTDGHGTHVAGTILGNGSKSSTVTNAQGSVTNANFRGMATNATGFAMLYSSADSYLQQQAAKTNAFISNNSWYYSGDNAYDISAASYDAAVRDALPQITGSQPVIFVFAAGNDGAANNDGTGGSPDSIDSPGTAKNVITVGAIEQPRYITNIVVVDGQTNDLFYADTDSSDQVADFSSRGNVGINVEGTSGRFKPDLIAPGTFVISDRSTVWNTTNYYDPTNFSYNYFNNESVASNQFYYLPSVLIPPSTVGVIVTLYTNSLSTTPFPSLPIYVAQGNYVTNGTPLGSNSVSLPTNGISVTPYSFLYFAISNNTASTVNFDVSVEFVITNDDGYYLSLSNLNNGVAPWYRYESGTSMSAAGVSGMLACMQEFFQGRLQLTNSPALMKALLINGARPLDDYDLQVATSLNSEGWGLPLLQNIIPPALANYTPATAGTMPLQFYDQSVSNALATGQSKTRNIALGATAQGQDMRITLVWTDPPGDPSAGIKLVNDLDLIVTNLDTGDVFFGNDIPAGSYYTESWYTNNPPNIDSVNNVENVYLQAPLGTNYSITVYGHRVNVNAVTANTNNIVQDYALVVSSGDASASTSLFTIMDANNGSIVTNAATNVFIVTNGIPLFNQRVGANSQFSGSTNGTAAQWNFYIYTNTVAATNGSYTNVAFLTFAPPNLGVPRMGASEEVAPPDTNATRYLGADIDLYVSTNPALTNLDTNVIAACFSNGWVSVTRTGTEKVLITNSTANEVYYIGVKSEDQQGAQYDFFGVATDLPFDQTDGNGDTLITILTPFPIVIPPGGPGNPNHGLVLGVSTSTAQVRKVVVTNSVQHQEFGDLIGTLTHGTKTAVLNNHTFFTNVNDSAETLIYDDSGENDTPGARTSDGPGTLLNFVGDTASSGIWMFTEVNDSSLTDTGQINNFIVAIQPQPVTNGYYRTINGNSWYYDYVDVPDNATNLTITVAVSNRPVQLYVREGAFPTTSLYDYSKLVTAPGGSISINKYSTPPLNAGTYYFGVYNPNNNPETVFITVEVDLSLSAVAAQNFLSVGFEPLLDDAVTYSTNSVGVSNAVVSAEVGVRINHPRESDLVLTLISPSGTRVLLAENRGGLDTNGYGAGYYTTNFLAPTASGTVAANANYIPLGTNTYGTLIINYNFYSIPDDMRIYYQGVRIFDSGLINSSGTFSVDFGPGSATNIEILMNEAGSNPYSTNATSDAWTYSAAVVSKGNFSYATFSENTNYATIPIKFAVPPFGAAPTYTAPVTVMTNSFEGDVATNYVTGFDGWTVVGGTNPVKVVTVTALANTGTNVLALHGGAITRELPTVAGRSYTLTFVNHGRPSLSPVGWWKGDDNLNDSSGNNNTIYPLTGTNGGYTNGVVNDALYFNNGNERLHVTDQPSLYYLTNALSVEGWIYSSTQTPNPQNIFCRGDSQQHSQPFCLGTGGGNVVFEVRTAPTGPSLSVQTADVFCTITAGVWLHLCGTYNFNGTNALLTLYSNGAVSQQITTTIQPQGALTYGNPGLGIGGASKSSDSFPFFGFLDEITLYSNALSELQVQDIYAAGSAGKCPVGGNCDVMAEVIYGGTTNLISGIDAWTTNVYSFTAPSNNMVLTIMPITNASTGLLEDGMLLDSFTLVQNPVLNPTNYYLPEESLAKVVGEPSQGNWLLEVLDNRVGATNPQPMLVSWELSLILADSVSAAIPIVHGVPQTNTVNANSIVYYLVNVPAWAQFATNILSAGSPLNLLFNQTVPPTSSNSSLTLLTGSGTKTLSSSNGTPLLLPGQAYYLGVQNTSASAVNFTLEVDFNITTLTNAIPNTSNNIAAGTVPRYFQFNVDSNAVTVDFQLLNETGNLELVISKGAPLPTTTSYAYETAVPGATNQSIFVLTNSTPVALSPGLWYLGVFNNASTSVNYTIEATETGFPNIIWLTNAVPTNFVSAPGPALTNFFGFIVTNSPPGVLFELYKLSGNVDLTLQTNAIPYNLPYYGYSHNSGTNTEQIVLPNSSVTNLNSTYYLGVPNNDSSNVSYTIRASTTTNGLLISGIPITLSTTLTNGGLTLTWPSVSGQIYELQDSTNLINWTTLATNTAYATSNMYFFPPPFPQSYLFFRVIQIP